MTQYIILFWSFIFLLLSTMVWAWCDHVARKVFKKDFMELARRYDLARTQIDCRNLNTLWWNLKIRFPEKRHVSPLNDVRVNIQAKIDALYAEQLDELMESVMKEEPAEVIINATELPSQGKLYPDGMTIKVAPMDRAHKKRKKRKKFNANETKI